MASEYMFSEERRAKATLAIKVAEMLIESLKAKDGNMKEGKYAKQFHQGYMAGVALGVGSVATYIENARIDETVGDILNGLQSELAKGLNLLNNEVETYT